MTIQHHPSEALLTAFAAGTLDRGQHAAIATHLVSCPHCRARISLVEEVGGEALANLDPSAMSSGAYDRVKARLNELGESPEIVATSAPVEALNDVPGLPAFVRRYPVGPWKWIAPRTHLRPILLPKADGARLFLLKSSPGTTLLEHTHTGVEMTCVLAGSFSHESGRFGPGDFDLGDASVDHKVLVDLGEDCICLVAMQGNLRLKGLFGRIAQPFIHM
jgi:putative transcriptional regulator